MKKSTLLAYSNNRGFTLVEVLVAVLILAFLILYVYNIVDNGTKTKEAVTQEDQVYMDLVTALARLENDISQAYSPLYFSQYSELQKENDEPDYENPPYEPTKTFPAQSEGGLLIPQFESPAKNEVVLFTVSNRRKIEDQKQSLYSWVKYSVRDTQEPLYPEGNQELVRQVNNEFLFETEHDWTKIKEHAVLTNLKELNILFWNAKRERFVESIRESDEDNVIRAILIEGILMIAEGVEYPFRKIIRPLYPRFDAKKAAGEFKKEITEFKELDQ